MINWTELRKTLVVSTGGDLLPPNVKLPVLPVAVSKFAQRAEDPDVAVSELSQIVETDAGLTTDLLRYANSSSVGLKRKASTVQQAISLLGIRDTKLFLLTTAVKRSMRTTQSKLINLQAFWATNLERAIFARIIARKLKANAELAYSAGMLQDFLLPIVSNELYPHYYEFVSVDPKERGHLADFESQRFRWTHANAAAQVMAGWKFPDDLICCVALHHRGLELLADPQLGKTAAAAVAIAALIPCPLRQVPDGLDNLVLLERAWPGFKLDEIAQQVETEFHELSPGQANHFSFRRTVEKLLATAQ